MRIIFFTYGPRIVASSRTRVFQYLPHLEKYGCQFKVIRSRTGLNYKLGWLARRNFIFKKIISKFCFRLIKLINVIWFQIACFRLLASAKRYDVIFIQKVTLNKRFVENLCAKDVPIVYDFDDAIYADAATDIFLKSALPKFKLAIIENHETKAYAEQTRTKTLMITGPIDCDLYRPSVFERPTQLTIGWIGSPSTSIYLELVYEVLLELCRLYPNLRISIVGTDENRFPGLQARFSKWTLDTEVSSLAEFDIGIMPLYDDEFSKGKGGYKILQYMALGIPSVASPVGVNAQLIQNGENGFLATDYEEWLQSLRILIENREMRRRMGSRARQLALEKYSFQTYTPILLNQLRSLVST